MRFWLLHSGEVPLQDQIVTQVSLGILSGELTPGERLPSVRELARRFRIHSNTVSLAYRKLERDQWLECRRGSGMYVRADAANAKSQAPPSSPALRPTRIIDTLFAQAVHLADHTGISIAELHSHLERAIANAPSTPGALLLIEPEPEFQRIVLAELTNAIPLRVAVCTWPALQAPAPDIPPGTLVLVRPSKAAALRAALPAGTPLFTLRINSVPQWLSLWLPAPTTTLVGVASQWEPFLEFARTFLVAAGVSADALIFRDPAQPGWLQGLEQTGAVVCDTHAATLLPVGIKAIRFPILAEDGLAELRERCSARSRLSVEPSSLELTRAPEIVLPPCGAARTPVRR